MIDFIDTIIIFIIIIVVMFLQIYHRKKNGKT